jgi:hypothetical protein
MRDEKFQLYKTGEWHVIPTRVAASVFARELVQVWHPVLPLQ